MKNTLQFPQLFRLVHEVLTTVDQSHVAQAKSLLLRVSDQVIVFSRTSLVELYSNRGVGWHIQLGSVWNLDAQCDSVWYRFTKPSRSVSSLVGHCVPVVA
jgi:hypothetical protein